MDYFETGQRTPGLVDAVAKIMEHGDSVPAGCVHFFHQAGLDCVSCSPYRVPIARLEAGRAAVHCPHHRPTVSSKAAELGGTVGGC
ncbi:hypothetical protein PV417_27625 [Streptomyces sp. ME19-03-3]|nr:hypothetical protein [Streptomyces sp. ME19-03-3]